jgi:hypothetical protein
MMERIEHVEVRVGIAELRKLLGVPDKAQIEAFALHEYNQGLQNALASNQPRSINVVSMAQCAPGTPIHELRIRFTKDQEAQAPARAPK